MFVAYIKCDANQNRLSLFQTYTFQTYLTTWSGRVLSRGLKVEASTKIQKLLQNLCEIEGFAINSVQIVHDGAVLDPERNLCSYGIGAETQLKLQRVNVLKRWTNSATGHVLVRIQTTGRNYKWISCGIGYC